MVKSFSRSRQVGDQIQRELSSIMQSYVQDAGLGLVTISTVELNADMRHAKIFITHLSNSADSIQDRTEALQMLNDITTKLRHQLSKKLTMRSVPRLQFIFDEHIEHADRLSNLLSSLNADH